MEMPIGICTCGNSKIRGSISSLITEHSESDLEKILNTDWAKEKIPGPLNENILRSVRSKLTILLDSTSDANKQSLNELAIWLKYKWPRGTRIKVRFLHRNPDLEPLIIEAAKEWEQHAFIFFDFVESGDADVRISLIPDGTSWSQIGTSCHEITDQLRPTMNFGWFNALTEKREIRRTTLHEFGHVLGCIHEHQSSGATIPWDANAVRRVYVAGRGHTEEWVQTNILGRFPSTDLTNSEYDRDSIMHYFFDSALATDGRVFGMNWELSANDKKFIRTVYPF